MNNLLVLVAIVSVLIGVLCGGVIVFVLFAARKQILANSLTHHHTLAGCIGTVQIPFDYNSKGKIRIYTNDSMRELIAFTDSPHSFKQGDQVLIVQIKNTHAWVAPGDIFDSI